MDFEKEKEKRYNFLVNVIKPKMKDEIEQLQKNWSEILGRNNISDLYRVIDFGFYGANLDAFIINVNIPGLPIEVEKKIRQEIYRRCDDLFRTHSWPPN